MASKAGGVEVKGDYVEIAGERLARRLRGQLQVSRTDNLIDAASFFLMAILDEAVQKGQVNFEDIKPIATRVQPIQATGIEYCIRIEVFPNCKHPKPTEVRKDDRS